MDIDGELVANSIMDPLKAQFKIDTTGFLKSDQMNKIKKSRISRRNRKASY